VEIFREFKVLNGAIVLAHGTILSILDISGTPIDKKTSKPVDTKWTHVNTNSSDKPSQAEEMMGPSFGRNEIEIFKIYFINVNANGSSTILFIDYSGT
jgi:hypothetical protein